jgi:hypothetical protein
MEVVMLEKDFLDPSKYSVTSKSNPRAEISDTQLQALKELADAQGDLAALNPQIRTELAGLQARVATDPNIAGDAAAIDFSVRAVSIHKTWSWFKSYSSSGPFDPLTLPRTNLNLADLVKRR